jgi:peroxygenase
VRSIGGVGGSEGAEHQDGVEGTAAPDAIAASGEETPGVETSDAGSAIDARQRRASVSGEMSAAALRAQIEDRLSEQVTSKSSADAGAGSMRTALQQHVDFFDGDGDGMITARETNRALRDLGFSGITARPMSLVINSGLGRKTGGTLLKVSADDIHLGKHAGDTGIYDDAGEFVPEKFERIWQRFDVDGDSALTQQELDGMIQANVDEAGGEGGLAARAEFYLLMDLAGETGDDGVKRLSRERLQSFYDGSLFPDIAAERADNPDTPSINRGLSGLARTIGGILGGRSSGPTAGERLTVDDKAAGDLTGPLSGARLAACPALQ